MLWNVPVSFRGWAGLVFQTWAKMFENQQPLTHPPKYLFLQLSLCRNGLKYWNTNIEIPFLFWNPAPLKWDPWNLKLYTKSGCTKWQIYTCHSITKRMCYWHTVNMTYCYSLPSSEDILRSKFVSNFFSISNLSFQSPVSQRLILMERDMKLFRVSKREQTGIRAFSWSLCYWNNVSILFTWLLDICILTWKYFSIPSNSLKCKFPTVIQQNFKTLHISHKTVLLEPAGYLHEQGTSMHVQTFGK